MVLAVAIVILGGCAENAALEMTFDLPPSRTEVLRDGTMGERRFVQVISRSAESHTFGIPSIDGRDPEEIALRAGERTIERITILSEDDSIDLLVRVKFCVSHECLLAEDQPGPESWFRLEHPFYIGERTR